jgi:hypothetical protein
MITPQETRCSIRTYLLLNSNTKLYVNAEIFLGHIVTVLFSNFAEPRASNAFAEEIAMSLIDNRSSRITSDLIGLLTEAQVCVVVFARHTTQILHVFDVPLFGVLKRRSRHELPVGNLKGTVTFIMKVSHDFKWRIAEFNT